MPFSTQKVGLLPLFRWFCLPVTHTLRKFAAVYLDKRPRMADICFVILPKPRSPFLVLYSFFAIQYENEALR